MARWLPPAFQKGIDIDAVDSAIDMPYDIPEFPCRICPRRTAGGADRFLARRRSQQQRVRHRMLHGRTGAQGRQGPGRFPPRHARQEAALAGGAQSRRGKIRLGPAAAGARRPRRLRAAVVRQLHRDRGGSRGRRAGRGQAAPRHLGGRYRHRGQSRYRHGAARGRADLRPDRRALWRDHHRQGPRAAVQFPRLPHAAHRPGAEDRGPRHQERRGARRHRRDRRHRRGRRRCATRSMPRPAWRCAGCRSTAL